MKKTRGPSDTRKNGKLEAESIEQIRLAQKFMNHFFEKPMDKEINAIEKEEVKTGDINSNGSARAKSSSKMAQPAPIASRLFLQD